MRTILPKNAIMVPEHATCVFKGKIFDTYQWEEKMFDGSAATFEMLKRPDTVEMLVIHDGKLLVQKQEQPHLGNFFGFPGGRHDHADETELEAAKRELLEETGRVCASWRLVRAVQSYSKIESFYFVFLATDVVSEGALSLDPGEKIENVWMTFAEVQECMRGENFRSGTHSLFEGVKEIDDLLKLPTYEP